MQQIDVEMAEPQFFCPVTGQLVLAPDTEVSVSSATRFIYIQEVDEFEFLAEDLERVAKQAHAAFGAAEELGTDDGHVTFFEHFLALLAADKANCNLAAFSLTTRGMACGPVCSTVVVGIDMGHGI